ncbi:hypothetical protein NG799_02360 [Laspinema sp. D1]|uniref:Rho termination factor N-terminal domain-containing protein n=1 Tax=Laspinema palackyanum D2a TaxID=2953684 RepID=A0ABT2MMP7_9CYAN|nr:hypothetical protein [Laspinema sp. D2a]
MKITEFKLAELKSACKSAGGKGYSALSKSELIEWIAASPRSADILAALPGAPTIECMEEKSSIEETAGEEIEADAIAETPSNSSGMDEKSAIDDSGICEIDLLEIINSVDEELPDEERLAKKGRAEAEEKALVRYGHDCSRYALDENGEILCHGSGPIEYADEDLLEEAKAEWIQRIRSLSSRLGAEAEGVAKKVTGKSLTFCSVAELQKVFSRLAQLSQLVGTDDSEPIPEEELSEDEREANAFGAKFVADFLEGGDGAITDSPETISLAQLLEQGTNLQPVPDGPFANPMWRIGFFYNGVSHAFLPDLFKSSEECQQGIDWIMTGWEELRKQQAIADCEEMVTALNQVIEEDPNMYAAIISNDLLKVMFWDTDEDFLVSRGKGGWYLDEELVDKVEGWSLRFNICKEALSQACNLIKEAIAEPEEETEEEKQHAIEAIKLDLALATDGDIKAMNECLGHRCDEAFGMQPPPPQHLRDRAVAIFKTSPPDGTGFVPSNGTTGDIWESIWCEQCSKFTESGCPIYIEALAGEPPAEWQYWDGAPLCTGFEVGIPPEESIAPPPPPEASTACPIFYPGDIVRRFIEPYIVAGPDKERPGNWLVRSQEFPEAGEYSLKLLWPHLIAPSKSYKFPEYPQSLFSLWNLAITNAHKIRLMDGWDNRDIAARLQDAGFQFANRIWDFCEEFESYEKLFAEFVTCGDWVIARSGCAIVVCWDPHLFIWQIESQDLDFWVNQIKSWQSEWRDPVIAKPVKTLLKATA